MGFYQNTRKPVGFGGTIMVRLMNVCHSPIATWGFSKLSMRDNLNILDIGCGGGKNIATWLRKSKNSHITGLDYSEVSVDESSKKNKWAIKRNRCEILRGNVAEMPFSDNTFDCVSAFETIYFWPGLEECFTEVNRVLKHGGIFMVCNGSDGENKSDEKWVNIIEGMSVYNEDQLHSALEKAGFYKIKCYINTEKHWLCIFAKKK
ncbi:class I SAM-dependent methyltransferase [Anaerotignum sp. MSJ-24]|uniref:class I SAM-dependent methyltransferase n=1 Tax=Anaerotignum sp. MSJ-24 TaxID=2841521 RepID=UPI001C103B9D|nr:class I SAM-dependent methyltransferase [Anaerotignum sp. MSJ-24]MBU5463606.1 class I SAM-dependent methyltransferase [Anaerotignum sp. MSJ-24]